MVFEHFDSVTLNHILESLFDHSFDPIVMTSVEPGYPIVYVNQRFCDMTGYLREELIGQSPGILQGTKTSKRVIERLKQRITQGVPFLGATTNYRKDGTPYPVEWKVSAVKDKEGNTVFYLSIQKDLTKFKQLLSRTKRKNEHFRSFLLGLSERASSIEDQSVKAMIEKETEQLVSDVLGDAAYYNPLLRSDHEREQFEDSEFFDLDHDLQGVISEPLTQTSMTATEYAEKYSGLFSVTEMLNLLDEAQIQVDLISLSDRPGKTYRELSETLRELAYTLFYLEEFVVLSSAINELADLTGQSREKEWPPFLPDIFSALISELTEWVTDVFIDRRLSDIHYLDNSIVSSCRQLISFVK